MIFKNYVQIYINFVVIRDNINFKVSFIGGQFIYNIVRNVFFIQIQCQREIFGFKNSLFSILVVCNSKKCFSLNINLFENIENYFRKDKKNFKLIQS